MLFDHADLRVTDLAKVRALYDALLPAMGFSKVVESAGSVCFYSPGDARAEPFLGLEADPAHRPNNSRLAFRASSRAEVDRLAGIAQAHGAKSFEPPQLCEDYTPVYYAAFFEDDDGNKLEVCFREAP